MTNAEFRKIIQARIEKRFALLEAKGKAYAGDGDVFANFNRNAERLNLTRFQIWAVYFNKHIDAINNAIAQNPVTPVDRSEGLQGRIDDAINYLELLAGMLQECPVDLSTPDPALKELTGPVGATHYQLSNDPRRFEISSSTKTTGFPPGTRFFQRR